MSYGEQLKKSQRALKSFVNSRIYNDADVEDIIQNVNQAALKKQNVYEDGRCFEAWIIGIAKYQILHHFKRNKKRVPTLPLDLCPEPFLDDIPFAKLVEEERRALKRQILGILTPKQRRIFKLLCLGYSTKEMAVKLESTHINITTTKYRLIQRAKAHLKKLNVVNGYDYKTNR